MAISSINPKGPGRAMVLLLGAFAALAPMAIDMYLPGVPVMSASLAASPQAATASMSIFFGGVAVCQLFAGPWSDRVGRKISVRLGLAVFMAGSLMAAGAINVGMLLLGRLFQAMGASAVTVSGRAVVRDMFEEREAAKFFSSLTLVSGLAPVLAPAVGAGLLAIAGWRAIFAVMGGFALMLLLAAIGRMPESRSEATRLRARELHPLLVYRALLANRKFLGYLMAAACNSGCYFTFLSAAPLVLMKIYGLSAARFSLVIGINAVGLVSGAQLNRLWLRKRHPQQILRGSSRNALLMAAVFALFAIHLTGGFPALLLLVFMVISSTSVIQSNTMAGALSVDPTRAGTAAALFGATAFAGGTAMSFVSGLLYRGTPRAMIAVMALGLLGTAASLHFKALPEDAAPIAE